jgi:hypothetical protein
LANNAPLSLGGITPFLTWACRSRFFERLELDFSKKGNRNAEFLRQEFEKQIFSSEQLIEAIEKAVADYIRRLEEIENSMLTRMKEDLPELPETSLLKTLEVSQLFGEYQKAVEKVIADMQTATGTSLAVDVVSQIASEVLTQVAIQLGISAGILGTGASSSWATLGISLVIGLVVDWIVSAIWDWYADPKGELAKRIDEKLDTLRNMIIVELRKRLSEIANDRSEIREKIIQVFLEPNP